MTSRRRSSTPGHVRRRGPDTWQVLLEAAPDPLTGARRRVVRTVRGTKADAERVRAELLLDVGNGRVEPLAAPASTTSSIAGSTTPARTSPPRPSTTTAASTTGTSAPFSDRGRSTGSVRLTSTNLYAALRTDGLSAKTIRNLH